MILECTACHARYLVPIGLFAQGGRTVRCARCKNQWHATLPTNVDIFLPIAPEEGIAEATSSQSPETSTGSHPAGESIAASTLAAAGEMLHDFTANLPAVVVNRQWFRPALKIAGGVIAFLALVAWPVLDRQQIVEVMPDLRDFYEWAGLHINHSGSGLIFDEVKSEIKYDAGTMRLNVDGVIHNTTSEAQLIPDIMARAIGPDKHIIQSWWVAAPAATVDAGGDVPFHTEVNTLMQHTIQDVYLEFYSQDEKGNVAH
jgi:predicted Zn finger-like uncharacterized protein